MSKSRSDTPAVLCGIHAVEGALKSGHRGIAEIVHERSGGNPRLNAVLSRASNAGVRLHQASKDVLDQLAGGVRHQGIVGLLTRAPTLGLAEFKDWLGDCSPNATMMILDGLEDPRNLGSCLRSAATASVDAVVLPAHEGAGLTPAALRVAAGGIHHLNIFELGNWSQTLGQIKAAGFWLMGASERAERSIFEFDLRGRTAWVFGSEGGGVRPLTARHCDALLKIPTIEKFPSLNVAVAAGVALFETLRQKRSIST
jgi:23S rRNA (guanosine2251-2'-O)-methyltransferase